MPPGVCPSLLTDLAYVRPSTLDDAMQAMALDGAAALAGGTDLVMLRAAGIATPSLLVDLKHLPELGDMEAPDDGIRIGAAVTMRRLTTGLGPAMGALADSAQVVGGPHTRNRATIGGNVCRSSPGGDTLAPLLVLGGEAELRSVREVRRVPLDEFFLGPGQNVRLPDELLTAVVFPRMCGASAYERFTYRAHMDLAVVGAAVRLSIGDDGRCDAAAVAMSAAAPTPRLVPEAAEPLVGSRLDLRSIEYACQRLTASASPIDDVRGTRRFRLRALDAVCRRAIARAGQRAAASRRD